MKEKQRNIEEEIDLTLESFNGIKPVEANPYIFEKVMNRMQNQKRNNYYPKLKYALVISLLILINLFTFIYFSKGSYESATNSDDIKDTFKKEYSLTISTYNY